jgi:hypothetical protein
VAPLLLKIDFKASCEESRRARPKLLRQITYVRNKDRNRRYLAWSCIQYVYFKSNASLFHAQNVHCPVTPVRASPTHSAKPLESSAVADVCFPNRLTEQGSIPLLGRPLLVLGILRRGVLFSSHLNSTAASNLHTNKHQKGNLFCASLCASNWAY